MILPRLPGTRAAACGLSRIRRPPDRPMVADFQVLPGFQWVIHRPARSSTIRGMRPVRSGLPAGNGARNWACDLEFTSGNREFGTQERDISAESVGKGCPPGRVYRVWGARGMCRNVGTRACQPEYVICLSLVPVEQNPGTESLDWGRAESVVFSPDSPLRARGGSFQEPCSGSGVRAPWSPR